MTYYKTLSANGRACNGGTGKWSLPILQPDGTWKPGRWMPRVENPVACERGYHLFEEKDVFRWVSATGYVAEYRGKVDASHTDKIAVEFARLLYPVPNWNDRTLRLFACRVAEDVLPLFEAKYPGDDRPRKAIEVARRYAEGEASEEELDAAAEAAHAAAYAAYAAAEAAAGAAYAAAEAAYAAAEAAYAGSPASAARAAARAGAGAARAGAGAAGAAYAAYAAARAAAEAAAFAKYTDWFWEMVR